MESAKRRPLVLAIIACVLAVACGAVFVAARSVQSDTIDDQVKLVTTSTSFGPGLGQSDDVLNTVTLAGETTYFLISDDEVVGTIAYRIGGPDGSDIDMEEETGTISGYQVVGNFTTSVEGDYEILLRTNDSLMNLSIVSSRAKTDQTLAIAAEIAAFAFALGAVVLFRTAAKAKTPQPAQIQYQQAGYGQGYQQPYGQQPYGSGYQQTYGQSYAGQGDQAGTIPTSPGYPASTQAAVQQHPTPSYGGSSPDVTVQQGLGQPPVRGFGVPQPIDFRPPQYPPQQPPGY